MIHIRIDDEELNSKRRFACGLGPDLPKGDSYYFQSEAGADPAADGWDFRSARYEAIEGTGMLRVGKKRAGRLLDGRTWSEFP